MIAARFNDVQEFLADLRADRELIDRDLVRLTLRRGTVKPAFQTLRVVASAVVAGHLVVLETFPMEYMRGMDSEAAAWKKARDDADVIQTAAEAMGLSVRPGVFAAA